VLRAGPHFYFAWGVFSVYQADVIHYGADLTDYFEREFAGWSHRPWPDHIKYIRFWSDLVERNI